MYKKLSLLIVMLFVVTAVYAQDGETVEVTFENVSFEYDTALAADVETEVVEAIPFTDEMPLMGATPEHLRFDFVDYAGQPDFFHAPRILVYRVADFPDFSISDEYGDYGYAPRAEDLAALLEEEAEIEDEFFAETELPFLPVFNAAQVLRAQVEYLEFESGMGLRFLSYYAQAMMPITSAEVFYTFQGLTEDGEYYVAAILPVDPGFLEAEIDNETFDWEAFSEDYEAYLTETVEALGSLPADEFTPSLEMLDALVASITIE